MFRQLYASEISAKVKTITARNSALILLYKDARVDMNILDETFGMFNWNKSYTRDQAGNLFCTVGARESSERDFVYKSDVGNESQSDKAKGEASDAFKRACFNWGIGRELYNVPVIFVDLDAKEVTQTSNNKKTTYTKFFVKSVQYKDNAIVKVVIVDGNGKTRFEGKAEVADNVPEMTQQKPTATMDQIVELELLSDDMDAKGKAYIEKALREGLSLEKAEKLIARARAKV